MEFLDSRVVLIVSLLQPPLMDEMKMIMMIIKPPCPIQRTHCVATNKSPIAVGFNMVSNTFVVGGSNLLLISPSRTQNLLLNKVDYFQLRFSYMIEAFLGILMMDVKVERK